VSESPRDQFQHPHFRGPKPCRNGRQFVEQSDQHGFQKQNGAQVSAEQVEAGLRRRRRPIRLPGRAGRLKFLLGDIDGRRTPQAKLLKRAHLQIDKTQLQFSGSLRIRAEIIEQPDQPQLRARSYIKP
jgi:hypothetical protein